MQTIAFLGAKGTRILGIEIITGILDVFKPQNINLLFFPIFPVTTDESFTSQQKILKRLLSSNRYQGLISWTSQLYFKDKCFIDMEEFMNQKPDLPFVSITRPVKNYPVIYGDDKKGIQQVMTHLIVDHGLTKIGFLRGPEYHSSMQLRYQSYLDGLKMHHIPFHQDIVAPPTQTTRPHDAMDSIRYLFDKMKLKPGRDIEALVCPTDFHAIGAINQLKQMNIKVPDEIMVTGFTNRIETREVFPAITSVDVNFREVGTLAAKTILSIINKEKVPLEIYTSTKLITRRSCCSPDEKWKLQKNKPSQTPDHDKKNILKKCLKILNNTYHHFDDQICEKLIGSFFKEISENKNNLFITELSSILDDFNNDKNELTIWQDIIDEIRRGEIEKNKNADLPLKIENIFHVAKSLIKDKADNQFMIKKIHSIQHTFFMNDLNSRIHTGFDLDKISETLEDSLPKAPPQVGFKSFYLATFKSMNKEDKAQLILVVKDNAKIPVNQNHTFLTEDLLPDEFFVDKDFHYLSLIPLYIEKNTLGFIVLETPLIISDLFFEELHNQLSIALEGAKIYAEKENLLQSLTKKEKKIREEYNTLKSRAELATQYINTFGNVEIVTQNKKMHKLITRVNDIARSKANVLITGETGVGKEIFARLLHINSERNNHSFIKVNCSAIPENLFESEFFGYEKGAFTGAVGNKKGKFELADRGILFLDEIGDLPLIQQAKLLRILEDKEIVRVGGVKSIKIDVRVIAATNKNLGKMIDEKLFREDLYFRLNILNVHIPSLKDRKDDIPILANFFLFQIANEEGREEKYFTSDALQYLSSLEYPGNIRELKNLAYRLYVSTKMDAITKDDVIRCYSILQKAKGSKDSSLSENFHDYSSFDHYVKNYDNLTLREFKNKAEKDFLIKQLEKHNGNMTHTARAIGIDYSSLYRKIKSLKIEISINYKKRWG